MSSLHFHLLLLHHIIKLRRKKRRHPTPPARRSFYLSDRAHLQQQQQPRLRAYVVGCCRWSWRRIEWLCFGRGGSGGKLKSGFRLLAWKGVGVASFLLFRWRVWGEYVGRGRTLFLLLLYYPHPDAKVVAIPRDHQAR